MRVQVRDRWSTARIAAVLTAAVLTGALAGPPGEAGATEAVGSIVFMKDFNVWIMPGDDPGAARPVTTDGTASDPYTWPTQDDAGTIMAFHGTPSSALETLVRMDQHGNLLRAPIALGREGARTHLTLSPDGRYATFTLVGQGFYWPYPMVSGTHVMAADGDGGAVSPAGISAMDPAWAGGSQVVMATHNAFWTYRVGDDEETLWFQHCGFGATHELCADSPAVDRTGSRLAATGRNAADELYIWELNGPPPAEPTPVCDPKLGAGSFSRPAWSPDGNSLVFHIHEHPEAPSGLYRMRGFGTGSCQELIDSLELIAIDAFLPQWSAAPMSPAAGQPQPAPNPAPGPQPAPAPQPTPSPTPAPGILRLAGAERTATAAAVSAASFATADTVFLSTASNFPDALAGGPLAARTRGPILLTGAGALADSARAELQRLRPATVVLLGGAGVLPDEIAAEAAAAAGGARVDRLSGGDRFATAAAIAGRYDTADRVYLATGVDFPDALTGAALAAARDDGPVLLALRDSLPTATATQLARLRPREIVILGGVSAVSDAVAQQASSAADGASITRLAGPERFSTAAAIAAQLPPTDLVYLATGLNFPDALTGTPAAALTRSPVLLTTRDVLPAVTDRELERHNPQQIRILGGEGVVSSTVAESARRHLR
jgi:putative cell wall-binding protein